MSERHDPCADPLTPEWREKVERAFAGKPSRELIERVATEEALAAGVTLEQVLHMGTSTAAITARRRAFARIITATGCSLSALAEAWGCDRSRPAHRYDPPKPRRVGKASFTTGDRSADLRPQQSGVRPSYWPNPPTVEVCLSTFAAIDRMRGRS